MRVCERARVEKLIFESKKNAKAYAWHIHTNTWSTVQLRCQFVIFYCILPIKWIFMRRLKRLKRYQFVRCCIFFWLMLLMLCMSTAEPKVIWNLYGPEWHWGILSLQNFSAKYDFNHFDGNDICCCCCRVVAEPNVRRNRKIAVVHSFIELPCCTNSGFRKFRGW